MKKLELVFVPVNVSSHLTSAIEFAKLLLDQDERLSITFLVILFPDQTDIVDPHTKSLFGSDARIRFTLVRNNSTDPPPSHISLEKFATLYIDSHVSEIERAVTELVSSSSSDHEDDSIQLVGFVLDFFCTSIIDVANKFSVPSYIFFSSNLAFLGFFLHIPVRHDQIQQEFHPSDPDSIIPTYRNPVPADVLPGPAFDKSGGGYETYVYHATRFQESKGIIVNSFIELESYAVNSIVSPSTVYTVGPLLNHDKVTTSSTEIKSWLDNQPPNSVVFLCFGNMGSFNEPQIEQMAIALERSGHRFLWSLRQPPPKGKHVAPTDYTDAEKVLPDGFLGRVKERGMVCGWAPQVQVLAHGAVKGFVSHCGWNSILESLWYGVPIVTWPLYAEQQLNAFLLVRELGLATELSLTYRSDRSELVMADRIEKAINLLMEEENPVSERVKEMSVKSRKALTNGGSSMITIEKLVVNMLHNIGEKQQ